MVKKVTSILLTHKYMNAHFPCLVRNINKKWRGYTSFMGTNQKHNDRFPRYLYSCQLTCPCVDNHDTKYIDSSDEETIFVLYLVGIG